MRLGGRIYGDYQDPDQWVQAHIDCRWRATYCPVDSDADDATCRAYAAAAEAADLVIAEVGAWSNPISPDDQVRRSAMDKCISQLALAERIGARCCVNISGSRGEQFNGPDAENYSQQTFELIVDSVRWIIDAVKPVRTFYTLEMMSWAIPDDPQTYRRLIDAIDRNAFAVHVDPVNMLNTPRRVYENSRWLDAVFDTLGPWIKSCHAKDVTLSGRHLVHIDECRPGTGLLDYRRYLRRASALGPDLPIMLEHLPDAEQYALAGSYLRRVAEEEGIAL